MSEKTLKFINKKEFHKYRQAIHLDSIITDKIVVSKIAVDKFRYSEEGFKYFIGYQEDEIVKPLCITHLK